MKSIKQMKEELIKVIQESKLIDYTLRFQDNLILIVIKEKGFLNSQIVDTTKEQLNKPIEI